MSIKYLTALTTAGILIAAPSWGQNVLYDHDFSGIASEMLHRTVVDFDQNGGGNNWTTRTDTGMPTGTGVQFMADGGISSTPGSHGAATLGFVPTAGNVYTLSASFGAIESTADPENWIGLGFASGQATGAGAGADFFGNNSATHTTGQPWMFYRGSNATGDFANGALLGPAIAEGVNDWSTPVVDNFGDPVDLRIVLDTTMPLWSVEWMAKNPQDENYTTVYSDSYTTNPTIRSVGFVSLDGVAGSISNFILETSGDVFLPGDTSGDGIAGIEDYDTIRGNFFEPLLGPANGDLNNDRVVDYLDFRIWKANATPAALQAVGLAVPEPSAWLIIGLGIGLLGACRVSPCNRRAPGA